MEFEQDPWLVNGFKRDDSHTVEQCEEWVPARVAVAEMAKVIYEAEELTGDRLDNRVKTILYNRLGSGHIRCRSTSFEYL